MAEEATAPVVADATKSFDQPTRPADAAEPAKDAEDKASGSGDVPADAPAEEQAPQATAATDEQIAKDDATNTKPDAAGAGDSGEAAASDKLTATNGTPASNKKANHNRRKSAGGVPEHKSKKTPSKKAKKEIKLNLNTKPGDMWLVTMRGYQPWPVIIADEDMLPESLLAKRPVSAVRIDGTYREDFLEGGKNAKDRRYPVMFLGTNEFAWQANHELTHFDLDAIKKDVESGNSAKKSKALWEAYQVAAKGHDLAYFKELLANHEKAILDDEIAKETKREEKAEKAKKAAKRKSSASAINDDVEMDDADDTTAASAKKAKSSKKRKKDADSEGDDEKAPKTPKTTLKLTTKKKPATETKKSKATKEESEPLPEEPPMTEEERLEKRRKTVLYLRHRLQKGFLTKGQPPKEEEMPAMSGFMNQLEDLKELEADIIKDTKIHKVLKKIIELGQIPRDEEFDFKKRSQSLLVMCNAALDNVQPATNGVKPEQKSANETVAEPTEKADDVPAASKDADGDVTMTETADADKVDKEETPVTATNGDVVADKAADSVETAA